MKRRSKIVHRLTITALAIYVWATPVWAAEPPTVDAPLMATTVQAVTAVTPATLNPVTLGDLADTSALTLGPAAAADPAQPQSRSADPTILLVLALGVAGPDPSQAPSTLTKPNPSRSGRRPSVALHSPFPTIANPD